MHAYKKMVKIAVFGVFKVIKDLVSMNDEPLHFLREAETPAKSTSQMSSSNTMSYQVLHRCKVRLTDGYFRSVMKANMIR